MTNIPHQGWLVNDIKHVSKYCNDIEVSFPVNTIVFGSGTVSVSLPVFLDKILHLNQGGFMQQVIKLAEAQCGNVNHPEERKALLLEAYRRTTVYDESTHQLKQQLVGRFDIDAATIDLLTILKEGLAVAEYLTSSPDYPFNLSGIYERCRAILKDLDVIDEAIFNSVYYPS